MEIITKLFSLLYLYNNMSQNYSFDKSTQEKQLDTDELLYLREFLTKTKEKAKNASNLYYNNKFTVSDDMTDEEKATVKSNVLNRNERQKKYYEKNKATIKHRQCKYRSKKRREQEQREKEIKTALNKVNEINELKKMILEQNKQIQKLTENNNKPIIEKPIIEPIKELKEPIKPIKEIKEPIKEPIKPIKEIKEPIKEPIKPIKEIKEIIKKEKIDKFKIQLEEYDTKIKKLNKRLCLKYEENEKYNTVTKKEDMENLKKLFEKYKSSNIKDKKRNDLKIEITDMKKDIERKKELQFLQDKIIVDIKEELYFENEKYNKINKALVEFENT